ncbi:helix-turn-helix transcriptional regulator [Corynebacterium sp. MSK041]|uniref:helix-turn-helix transcriptional regulator n=1 Tax=Corynebacterium sp. MSK041 TaxID=3050194 RepID=UPI00254DE9E0|nr:helix-turn-helix transcriptional regulator [Corynebacterium sp. MSK041]MDK8795889.1 helix-turn-helix transcriptional regulator [Corynebacterium sp. MSK041]
MSASPNTRLGNLVRSQRSILGMTQEDLAEKMGKSRQWVIQIEKGVWNNGKQRVSLTPENAVKLALILDGDPQELLMVGDVPIEKWPDLSHFKSLEDNRRLVDITGLTSKQQALIESLVYELKTANEECS